MKNVFERAAGERGTGMKIRMNQHLESGSRSAVNKACDLVQRGLAMAAADAMKSVLDEVSPAAGKIDAKSARITSSLVEVAPNRKFATEEQMTKLTKAVNAARQIVAPAIRFDPGVLAKTPPKAKAEPVDQVLAATPSTLEPIFVDASNVADPVRTDALKEPVCESSLPTDPFAPYPTRYQSPPSVVVSTYVDPRPGTF